MLSVLCKFFPVVSKNFSGYNTEVRNSCLSQWKRRKADVVCASQDEAITKQRVYFTLSFSCRGTRNTK